ncbi:unnamed protein product [Paramecium pentaurelia]|uniref:Uncharacterized protein n=1 Tax=Paramecium pentaurelia TaxID=43138 RepID=A0A8S1SNH6_9CILI|nr:unnamed protein product [Paramecium pentaurelia]
MQQITSLQCQEHFEKIQFLDLRQKILKGERAKCCKCQLSNPIYIEAAFEQWIQKKQNEIQQVQNDYLSYINPLKQFYEQMKQIKKSFYSSCEHIMNQIDQLINGLNFDKISRIQDLQLFDENITLSTLQEMAQLMSEKAPILKKSKTDINLLVKLRLLNDFIKQEMNQQNNFVIKILKQQQQAKEVIENFKEQYLQNIKKYEFKEIKNIYNIKQYEICRVVTFNKDDSITITFNLLIICNFKLNYRLNTLYLTFKI